MSRSSRNKKRSPRKEGQTLKIILIVVFVLGVSGVFSIDEIAGKVFFFLLAVGSGYMYWKRYMGKGVQKSAQKQGNAPLQQFSQRAAAPVASYNANNPMNTQARQAEPVSLELPPQFWGALLTYQYQNKEIAMVNQYVQDFSSLRPGDQLRFVQEPSNTYDPRTVQVWKKEQMLGYIYKGQTQDMINDFIVRDDPVYAVVSGVSPVESKIYFNIGFYKKPKAEKLGRILASGRLTTNSGEEAQDNIAFCTEGEEVSVDYDYEKERYEVFCGEYIGCLPKRLEFYADKNVVMVISEIGELDSGKSYVEINVHEEIQ